MKNIRQLHKKKPFSFVWVPLRLYRLTYIWTWVASRLYAFVYFCRGDKPSKFVLVNTDKGWILEGICLEIRKYCNFESDGHDSLYKIPYAKTYFFSHYSSFAKAITRTPHILCAKNLVFYTHHRAIGLSEEETILTLNYAYKVITMNSLTAGQLAEKGVDKRKLITLVGGADEQRFQPKGESRNEMPSIGFCLRFSQREIYSGRKRYDIVLELVKSIDFANIILLGKNWRRYSRFKEMESSPRFEYVETDYENYPEVYNRMDIFVSVSSLEGGPIPLLEAMMCNVFPVVSRTGFAVDIIENGVNGLLFEVDSSTEHIVNKIKYALSIRSDVRESVINHSWKNFSHSIQSMLQLSETRS